MRKILALGCALFILSSAAAWAQDFGQEWMDRVTRQMEQEKAPLRTIPLEVNLFAGERVYYDTNIYLEDEDEEGDTVFVSFADVRLNYAEENFDATVDLLANYNYYVEEEDARSDEERFYGRARYAGNRIQIEVAEVLRRESDPYVDPQVVKRTERFVTNTLPRIAVAVTDVITVEANGELQYTKFAEDVFQGIDNFSYRAGVMGSYELPSGIQILLDAGLLGVNYVNDPTDASTPGVPDALGYYARIGFRGEIQQRLYISALAGPSRATSESVDELNIDSVRTNTADVSANLRFEATEKLVLYADYTRRFGYGAWESYDIINRATAGVEFTATEKLKLAARGQYDYIIGLNVPTREYGSVSALVNYTLFENLVLDGSATYRQGELDGTLLDYVDGIFSLGAALVF
jgi:hypothetical protein